MEVTWKEPRNTNGAAVLHYVISTEHGEVEAVRVPGAALFGLVDGLQNGHTYSFAVTAYTVGGASERSKLCEPVRPVGPPDVPMAVNAKPGDGQVEVTWQQPAHDGGMPISSYTVAHVASDVPPVTVDASQTKATVYGLHNGSSASFRVTATNAVGEGSPSAATTPVVPIGHPSKPTDLKVCCVAEVQSLCLPRSSHHTLLFVCFDRWLALTRL